MTTAIRWGVAGTGFAAVEFGEGNRLVPGSQITAVYSRSQARCARYAKRFSVSQTHSTFEGLVNSSEVDAVYIASHNHLHAKHCISALNSGKAVLCEKPFALNAAEASQVIELARVKNLFCMEAMRTALLPVVSRMQRIVASGEIGMVTMLQASIGHRVPFDAMSRVYDPALGGGALLDIGCYPIALSVAILGKPDSISARATFAPTGVDDSFAAILKFRGGALAVISASLNGVVAPDSIIVGTRGVIHLHGAVYSSDRMTVRPAVPAYWPDNDVLDQYPESGRLARMKSSAVARRIKPIVRSALRERTAQYLPGNGNGFTDEIAEAVMCIRDGKSESGQHPLDRTLIAMEVIDEIRRQCE